MRIGQRVFLSILLLALASGCAADQGQLSPTRAASTAPATATKTQNDRALEAYEKFAAVMKGIPTNFHPESFKLFNWFPDNAVYYGFDRRAAWGKRDKTVVNGDSAKPSQAEIIYIHNETQVAIAVMPMFIPQALEPDVVGMADVPAQEGKLADGTDARIQPPKHRLEMFSYDNAVFTLLAFPPSPDSDLTRLQIALALESLSIQLKDYLDKQTGRLIP